MSRTPAKRFTLRSTGDSKVTCCVPANGGYEDARVIWNGMVARTPGLIARCADVADVQNAVRPASEAGILTAVRCGGHSLAGFSTCDGGMVIDLSTNAPSHGRSGGAPGADRRGLSVGID